MLKLEKLHKTHVDIRANQTGSQSRSFIVPSSEKPSQGESFRALAKKSTDPETKTWVEAIRAFHAKNPTTYSNSGWQPITDPSEPLNGSSGWHVTASNH